jgi:hypothetical protein
MNKKIVIKKCTKCGRYTTLMCDKCGAKMHINKLFNTAMCPNGHGYFDIEWKDEK